MHLDEDYDPSDQARAFETAINPDKFPMGVLYQKQKKTFEEMMGIYEDDQTPLYKRNVQKKALHAIMSSKV